MSFFSYLILAANSGIVTKPDQATIQQICLEIGLTKVTEHADYMYNIHPNIAAIFRNEEAMKLNDRFFRPDTVALQSKLSVTSFEAEEPYAGPGYNVAIPGYGYFFPWTKEQLKALVESPPFCILKQRCDELFGGGLAIPDEAKELFDEALITESPGWTWLKSES